MSSTIIRIIGNIIICWPYFITLQRKMIILYIEWIIHRIFAANKKQSHFGSYHFQYFFVYFWRQAICSVNKKEPNIHSCHFQYFFGYPWTLPIFAAKNSLILVPTIFNVFCVFLSFFCYTDVLFFLLVRSLSCKCWKERKLTHLFKMLLKLKSDTWTRWLTIQHNFLSRHD